VSYKTREQRRLRAAKTRGRKLANTYWLTPKAWNKDRSHCGQRGSIAYRPSGRTYACSACVERLGIEARESASWRNGGARAGSEVIIRWEKP
jgi:hypothetical protein